MLQPLLVIGFSSWVFMSKSGAEAIANEGLVDYAERVTRFVPQWPYAGNSPTDAGSVVRMDSVP